MIKWIGKYVQDLYSIFRSRVLIERKDNGADSQFGSFGTPDATLTVNQHQLKNLSASEYYSLGVDIDMRDKSTTSHASSVSSMHGLDVTITDEDADGIKVGSGIRVACVGGEQVNGVMINMSQGTAASSAFKQALYINGCGTGTHADADIKLVSKNNSAKGATIDVQDDGELTIKTYDGFASNTNKPKIILSTGEQSWPATPSGCHSAVLAKILPNEFMVNDDAADAGATNAFVVFDDDLSTMGAKISNTNSELFAFFKIPNGRKVAVVQVHGSASTANACRVYSYNYTTGARAAALNYEFDINEVFNVTDIGADNSTTDMILEVAPASSNDVIFGASIYLTNV